MAVTQDCHAVDWNAVQTKVTAKQWQAAAEILDGVDVKTLRPTEAAAYSYYMGVCAYHSPGREAFGRILLLDLLQHRMNRVGDSKVRERIKQYVEGLLKHRVPDTVEEWHVAATSQAHTGSFSGKGFYLGDLKTEIKPLRMLQNVAVMPQADLLKILRMPEDQAISNLNTQLLNGTGASVGAIQSTPAYSLIVVSGGASGPTPSQASQLAAFSGDINTALTFFQKEFGVMLPHERLVLFTAAGITQLQAIARRLHGIEPSSIDIGYSVPDELTAVATGDYSEHRNTGTLYHELCHIVFQNDFPAIPGWLDEGLASLYSVFEFKSGTMHGLTRYNMGGGQWRGEVLSRVGRWHPGATELVRMTSDDFFDPQTPRDGFKPAMFYDRLPPLVATQATNNATACYLLLYLQEKGKLSALYRAFRDRDPQKIEEDFGDADVKLLKQIAGETIDHDFEDWLTATIAHGGL
jgi:hypothetical protein